MDKELGPILEDISISLSLNLSYLCYEVSLEELKSLLDSYNFQVSLIGDMCIIAFEGNLFLLGPSMKNFLSSHFSLEDLLMSCSIVLDPSCYGFGNLDDTSLVELNIVGFVLEFDWNSLQHVCPITSTRGRRHTMEFEGQGESVGGKLILCYGDLTISLSSNLFLFYLVFSFLELNAFYVIVVGDCMVNLFTYELLLVIEHMLKYSSSCSFLEKQVMVSIARIKPSYHDLELLHDNLIFDRLFANVSTSCASVWRDQEEDFKRSKAILWSSVQVEESKEANLGKLEAFKTKRGAISGHYRRRQVPTYRRR
ncbi:hypothetical protein M9H77_02118 [Catharanthus roseus]|uniref:Uncharacterized protein n=1 Tax=Catharanthus roseus TaxID=4058 RepID=A0ACC0C7X8_CATRO|nr:hypothetical protein M9H77_02118 [Catharanthus roseus]